jgi:hypothetical protein
MNATEMRAFRGYLKTVTDAQVRGCYEKEKAADREDYAELCVAEAERRGIDLDGGA